MKKLINRLKRLNWFKLVVLVDRLVEHRLFKPVVISIITSFLLFRAFEYGQNLIDDYRDDSVKQRKEAKVKVNISANNLNLNIDEDQIAEHNIKFGDTMLKILTDIGAGEQDVFNILSSMKKLYNPKLITVGDHIIVKYKLKINYEPAQDAIGNISRKIIVTSVSVSPSVEKEVLVSRKPNGEYEAKEIKINLTRHVSKYSGIIKNGLFVDGVDAGLSPSSMMNMINLYSYDVDFQRDIQSGDKFEILVESFYREDGKKVKDGNVLFSSLTLKNRAIDIYMHKIDGKVEYFDAKGNSTRKSLLRTPINGARVSSGFGFRRHPILGYSKLHKGIDFAAPSGTPIFAAGSGTITYYSRKGGYGNFVEIKHNSEYSTAYGHASRYVKKLRVGSKVKQGEVVAYVGSTGRSTGPHLHFEVIHKGSAINPAKVKATSGLKLFGKESTRFQASKTEIDGFRKNIPNQIQNAE